MKQPKCIIIDGAGTATTQNFIHAVGKSTPLLSLDCSEQNVGKFFSDGFLLCPKATSDKFVPFLEELFDCYLKDFEKILYIPIIDYGFSAISKHTFNNDVLVVISPYETIKICDDKLLMSRFFKSIECPFNVPKDMEDILINSKVFPDIIIKPRKNGRGSIDVSTCNTFDVFLRQAEYLKDNFFYQEKIPGKEVTVDVLCTLGGKYLGSICRERVEVKSGVSSKARVFHSNYYDTIVKFICNNLKFSGHINIQFMENNKGVYLIEINPRYSGGYNLSDVAGFHSVSVLLKMFSDWCESSYNENFDYRHFSGKDSLSYSDGYSYKYSKAKFETINGKS